jgi:hypothetical protein
MYLYTLRQRQQNQQRLELMSQVRRAYTGLVADTATASSIQVYESFQAPLVASTSGIGDYLVAHFVDLDGKVYKTLGYYTTAVAGIPGLKRLWTYTVLWQPMPSDPTTLTLPSSSNPPAQARTLLSFIQSGYPLPNTMSEQGLFNLQSSGSVFIKGHAYDYGTVGSVTSTSVPAADQPFAFVLVPWNSR